MRFRGPFVSFIAITLGTILSLYATEQVFNEGDSHEERQIHSARLPSPTWNPAWAEMEQPKWQQKRIQKQIAPDFYEAQLESPKQPLKIPMDVKTLNTLSQLHSMGVLTPEKIAEARRRFDGTKRSAKALLKEFGISKEQALQIKNEMGM